MDSEEITAEIAELRRKLAARENKPGFKANAELLKYVIAGLEAQIA